MISSVFTAHLPCAQSQASDARHLKRGFRHYTHRLDTGAFQHHRAQVTGFRGVLPDSEPVADSFWRTTQRNLVDELIGNRRRSLVLFAVEVKVLNRLCFALETEFYRDVIVVIFRPRSHPTYVKRELRPDKVPACGR